MERLSIESNDYGPAWDGPAFVRTIEANIAPEVMTYHEERRKGRIPQCEEWGWGHSDSANREFLQRLNNTVTAQSFREINWGKDAHFTGRGVDPTYDRVFGEYPPVGPKGETVEDVKGSEPPTAPETRDLWTAVDQGHDDGVDPLYRVNDSRTSHGDDEGPLGETRNYEEGVGPLGERNEDDEDENVGPLGESMRDDTDQNIGSLGEGDDENNIRHHQESSNEGNVNVYENTQDQIQAYPSGGMGDTSQSIAEKGYQRLLADLGPLDESHKPSELYPFGERRGAISEESSQSQRESSATPSDVTSSRASRDTASACGKKRSCNSVEGDANAPSQNEAEDDADTSSPSPKRLRTSSDDGSKASVERPGYIYTDLDDATDNESERSANPLELKCSRNPQRVDEATLRELSKIGESGGIWGSQAVIHKSPEAGKSGNHEDPKSPESRGTKRLRGDERRDEGGLPVSKRSRRAGMDLSGNHEAGSESEKEVDPTGEIRPLRPTFYGTLLSWNKDTKRNEFTPDNNEAGDWVVMGMREIQPAEYGKTLGTTPAVTPDSRLWTADEEEKLRFWVQDNGIERWNLIAWCLRRTEKDCQVQYRRIVRRRNLMRPELGRDPNAGLPGWIDPELRLSPQYLAQEAQGKGRKQARLEEEVAEMFGLSAAEEEPMAYDVPAIVVKLEPEPWREVEGEEPELVLERPVGANTEAEASAGLETAANTDEEGEAQAEAQAQAQAQALAKAQAQAQVQAQAQAQIQAQAQAQMQAQAHAQAQVQRQAQAHLDGPPSSRLRARKAKATIQLGHGLIRYDPKAKAFPKVTSTGALVDSKDNLLCTSQRVEASPQQPQMGGVVTRGRIVKRTTAPTARARRGIDRKAGNKKG